MDLREKHQRTPDSCSKDGVRHHHWRSIDAPATTTILTWIGISRCFGVEKKRNQLPCPQEKDA